MVSLRKAKFDDHWRRLYKQNYNSGIYEVGFVDNEHFSNFNMQIRKGLSAIIGRNGVGKSNVVRALYNCFSAQGSNRKSYATTFLSGSDIRIKVTVNRNHYSYLVAAGTNLNKIGIMPEVTGYMFDPCILVPALQHELCGQDNFEEMLDGYSPVQFDADDLKIINYLTHGEYDFVDMYNIEDEFDDVGVVPFFRVRSNGSIYDARDMGLGELSLFYFYWLLKYLDRSESDVFLFIEEPESFLPPTTQERLINILAMHIAEKSINTILSTHSEHILKRIPENNIYVMRKANGKITTLGGVGASDLISVLGLTAHKVGMVLCEDSVAAIFSQALIKVSMRMPAEAFYYKKSGSNGEIVKDLEQIPGDIKGFAVIGIFDGDCRINPSIAIPEGKNGCYLPTEDPPEKVLIDYVRTLDEGVLSNILNVPTENIGLALDASQGSDHHDYFVEFSRVVDKEFAYVVSSLSNAWVEDEINNAHLDEFQKQFSDILR